MTLYLYGLVAAGRRLPRGMKGVAGEKVRSLKLGSLGALASPIGGELALDLDDLGAHAAVVEAAFAKGPILPFRAGTVVEEDVLRNEVALYLPDYEAQLAELDGLCELEVTAWYREEPVVRQILSDNAEIRDLSRTTGPDSDVGSQVRLGELIGAELERRLAAAESVVSERLGRVAAAVSPRLASGREVLRASCLVRATTIESLVSQARTVPREMPWLSVDVAGPVAPYSFVGRLVADE